jgi:nuclear cap-binding protein subunit 1
MVAVTVGKVTNRVRQIVAARVSAVSAGLPEDQIKMLEDTLVKERHAMRQLFAVIEDSVAGIAVGASDGLIEAQGSMEFSDGDTALVKLWGERWARVFRRKLAVEEAIVGEIAVEMQLVNAVEAAERAREREAKKAAAEEAEKAAAMNGQNGNGTAENGHDSAAATSGAMDEDVIE